MNISVFKPSITRKEMDAVLSCMVSDRIGFGKLSSEFVKEISTFLNVAGGFAFKEYYRAVRFALDGLQLKKGATIAVSALAPRIYLLAIEDAGFDILPIDVDLESSLMNIAALEEVAKNVDAIIINYEVGFVPDMEKIMAINIPVIEDISMALGSSIDEKKSGSWGSFTILNMDEDGIITVGGGTAVLGTSRKNLKQLKGLSEQMHPSVFLPDMNASLGSIQLKNLESYLSIREDLSDIFSKSLMQTKHKRLFQKDEYKNVNYSFPVLLETGISEVAAYCNKKNVLVEPAFADSIAAFSEEVQADCPNAKTLLLRCVNFPLYPMLGKRNISTIAKVLSSLP